MHDVALAFFWHQHQPYYPDDVAGENPMPWVRLHGTKDYWGMAALLDEVPALRATINLVPSLLVQILAYTESGQQDRHLRVSRTPIDGLSEDDLLYLLDDFFMVHAERMIHPFSRFAELYQKRAMAVDTAEQARRRFSRRDLLDLVVWGNLVWIHPLAFERDAGLGELRRKGKGFTEQEKEWLLDRQMELVAEVIPRHKRLEERGQIELTTSPFYHPILPLLLDKRLARQAMPGVTLPAHLESYRDDAADQIRSAVALHERLFGRKPRGMWPSEGSVCQGLIPLAADAGIHWMATDEEILARSTDGWVSRDSQGHLRNPEMLYRPWRAEHQGRSVQIIFRDHAMSDQIGFHYQRFDTDHAVEDFIGKVEAIGRATRTNAGQRPTLVSIILDGENCWEYYPNGGVDFLRRLYRRVVDHPKITPVQVSEYLERYPAADRLGAFFPGSWIQHNFGIWIGHPECNRAWDLLHETRRFLVEARGIKSAEKVKAARRELMIAEGSDWFWWFGDSHQSAQDVVFDRLFRKHLQNVYTLLDEPAPPELARPISQGHPHGRLHTEPTSLLKVKIDGRRTYFEWINAGHHVCEGPRGAMALAEKGRISDLYFGFDEQRLLIRLDTRGGPARERLVGIDAVAVVYYQPEGYRLEIVQPALRNPRASLCRNGVVVGSSRVEAAGDVLLEVGVPLRALGTTTDDPIHFCVELLEGEQSVERVPHEGAIETTVPPPDFELIMWQA